MSGDTVTSGRRYAGLTAEERAAQRREQLVDAGLELFGTLGFSGTSIRAVLRESGLAERYFYESFDSLEALLVGVHERIHAQVAAAVRIAAETGGDDVEARTRAGLRAFIEEITTDPRFVRIKLQELSGHAGDEVRAFRNRAFTTYANLIMDYAPQERADALGLNGRALAIAVLSAMESLIDSWAGGELPVSLDDLIEHAVIIVGGTVDRLERDA